MPEDSLRTTFNEVPALYDRLRPAYPSSLFADLATLAGIRAGSRVLEIGPGTGQATAGLTALGAEVVAVEIGADLAEFLRSKTLPRVSVATGSFEEFLGEPTSFDAISSFTSWHWLEVPQRADRVAALLRPGGALVTVTTTHVRGGTVPFFESAHSCYGRWDPATPEIEPFHGATELPEERDEIDTDNRFGPAVRRRYEQDIDYSRNDYLDLLQTYSGHRALPPDARAGLLVCLGDLIDDRYGGQITKRYLFELRCSRRLNA